MSPLTTPDPEKDKRVGWIVKDRRPEERARYRTDATSLVVAEVIRALVVAISLLLQVHEDTIGQTARNEAEPVVAPQAVGSKAVC